MQASSISSFHSVSLSDGGDGPPPSATTPTSSYTMMDGRRDSEVDSLDESFETLSTTSSAPTFEWPAANGFRSHFPIRNPPPPPPAPLGLPQSPPVVIRTANSPVPLPRTTPLPYVARRPPPIPPRAVSSNTGPGPTSPRASVASTSDRSSILSVGTATTSRTSTSGHDLYNSTNKVISPKLAPRGTSSSLLRPTPIPAAPRARYEAVFAANVYARQQADAEAARELSRSKARKTGWRGLSVDLITGTTESHNGAETRIIAEAQIGSETTLSGHAVSIIWSASKLGRNKLRSIWFVFFV